MYWCNSNKLLLYILVGVVIFILAACGSSAQPAATLTPEPTAEPTFPPEPTATPQPLLAANMVDIVGIWEHPLPGVSAFMEIREDGTFTIAGGVIENLADQPYTDGESWFEENRFKVKINGTVLPDHKTCIDLIGTYEVQLLADGILNFVVIEDDCEIRARATLAGEWIPVR